MCADALITSFVRNLWSGSETDRQTDRQTKREAETDIQTYRHKETGKQRERTNDLKKFFY